MSTLLLKKNSPEIFSYLSKINKNNEFKVEAGNSISLLLSDGTNVNNTNTILKELMKQADIPEIDQPTRWIDLVYKVDPRQPILFDDIINEITKAVSKTPFLNSERMSVSDICVLSYLDKCRQFMTIKKYGQIVQWLERCMKDPLVEGLVFNNLKFEKKICEFEDGGRFLELPHAKQKEVVVRFPPEASGYLHIGHAKAALLNQFYRDKYDGKLIVRFDDTNPVKEKNHFEEIILEDIKMLGLTPDHYSKTSDFFDVLITYAEELIKKGLAYCDDTPTDLMRDMRLKKQPSAYRESSIELNLTRWNIMKQSKESSWCLRAKIDYQSKNGCMRDPTIYRNCSEPHPTVGTKYCVYPTYDFACPIVDSIEGVTHALRTSEYKDRDEQYYWVVDNLGLRRPILYEYSRLNLQSTVLSKRKLTKIVDSKIVDGWDDPRMPTVRGYLRRGLTLEGLKQFILAQGFSKSVVNMCSDKLWSFNKRTLEPTSYRMIALDQNNTVVAKILNTESYASNLRFLPKDSSSPSRPILYGSNILIEKTDLSDVKVNDILTLMNWGNAQLVTKTDSCIELNLQLENKNFSNTPKVSWICLNNNEALVQLKVVTYKNLLTKSVIGPDDDFEIFIDHNSKLTSDFVGEAYFKNLKKGNIIQILRKGFYICDKVDPIGGDVYLIEIPTGAESDIQEKSIISKNSDKKETKKTEKPKKSNVSSSTSKTTADVGKKTKLGLSVKKKEDFSSWYSQILTKSELLDYYDISGCYVLRPLSYFIWEQIHNFFDREIKALGVSNCYFPMFVSEAALNTEKTHISDFAPEVAWVTRAGNTDLSEPIAIRPTSETVIYPIISKWIQSYRDLPIKLNQWCNVIRWEFKHPTPFLRTREFLWQEGHTVYSDKKEAVDEVYKILDLYERVYVELLAIPMIKGRKSEAEKFAGAEFTLTVEGYIDASGRGLQGGTSHHLGQNFSKMFDIGYEDVETHERSFAYQNSWGISTRSIGALVMIHGDDKGLVLPPRVAQIQIVIIPCGITSSITETDKQKIFDYCVHVQKLLSDANLRVYFDNRDYVTVGWRFNHYELKGVPLRIEIGPKEQKQSTLVGVRRDNGEKYNINVDELTPKIKNILDTIHANLYENAKNKLNDNITLCENWEEFMDALDKKKLILSPFCNHKECEEFIRKESTTECEEVDAKGSAKPVLQMGAKTLCIPLKQPKVIKGEVKCIRPKCQNTTTFYALFGRSY